MQGPLFTISVELNLNIHALVLLNLLNSLRKREKMLGTPCILSLFPNSFNKLNKTWALMQGPLFTISVELNLNILALVLLNLLNSLRKRDKMLGTPCILSRFPNSFNKFNKTWVLMQGPLFIMSVELNLNILALVLLNLLNSLRKRDKMLGTPCILSRFPNSFNKFNKTWVLM